MRLNEGTEPESKKEQALQIDFLAQPDVRLGDVIDGSIQQRGLPNEFVVVSAFASLPTVLRMKPTVEAIRDAGGTVRIVLGVDMGGTSKEVLQEVASWNVTVFVIKNRTPGTTFHPKIYFLRWEREADLIVGSNNLTDGGLYRNFEAASRTSFQLPEDLDQLQAALAELTRFINPSGPTALAMSPTLLGDLLALSEIPSESESRRARGEARSRSGDAPRPRNNVFGIEPVRAAPPLPLELQRFLLQVRNQQNTEWRASAARARRTVRAASAGAPVASIVPIPPPPELPAQLDPEAFYMNPVTTTNANNPNIPGEQRIPLEALEMAADFWGWPGNYDRTVSPRAGAGASEPRVYRNWRTPWRIWSTDDPGTVYRPTEVRLYFYENNSDFRFYSSDLNRLGLGVGDIIRLRRIDEDDAVFECVLARVGTTEHAAWIQYLVLQTRNNPNRRFGFA